MGEMWTRYRVRWDFLTKLCGQTPADPEIVAKWLAARQPAVRLPGTKSLDELQAEVFESLKDGGGEAPTDYSLLVFAHHPHGPLAFRAATIKAHLKDCARVLANQHFGKIKGERSFSTKVVNGVYPDPKDYWVPILRPDGTPILVADGAYDKPVHARGPRGEMLNALKRLEYVEPARMDFTLLVLGDSVRHQDLETLMEYGGVHGYAGERSDGEGRYVAQVDAEARSGLVGS